jgi:ABC-type uncharacterized transport system involved in gliding motility auxiliary subunit
MVSAASIFQNIGKNIKVDMTEQKLYTLSDGTKAILGKLNQPVKLKLYYTRTAAMKGPDDIRFFNNYFYFVQSILEEYASLSSGKVSFEFIDPRPYSQEEAEAIKFGLKRIPMSEDESFIFGLVLQTQFGVNKTIEFFEPQRQSFVEYDISKLIDTAMTREKRKIGVLSSLPVMGDDTSGYMAQMMQMQGKQPKPAWTIIEQIKMQYDVQAVRTDVNDINDIDLLLVIHPKELSQKTLFAIDQFVLKGGRTIVCVDPHSIVDQPDQQMMQQMQVMPSSASGLNVLLEKWGLSMAENKFAGDRGLAITTTLREGVMPEKLIAFLNLNTKQCFNQENIISSQINDIRVLFAGVLIETNLDPNGPAITRTPLISTTDRGNEWSVSSPYDLMMLNSANLMSKFYDGTKPVCMGYQVTGKFQTAFPDGIEIESEDPNIPSVKRTGLTQASEDCSVVVFSDVDFMTDMLAYNKTFFGMSPVGDNAALLMNAIDNLGGSGDLISIRSKGNLRRDFEAVKKIEDEVALKTSEEETRINAEIQGFQAELQKMLSSGGQQDAILSSELLGKKKDIEEKLYQAQLRLREVKNQKRQQIEGLKAKIRNFDTLPGPILILIIAIVLGIRRGAKKRHYISHASDA